MKKIILASHGSFSIELKNSLEMIMGEQENIAAIGLEQHEGEKEFLIKVEEVIGNEENYVVFTDLFGGTPCNVFGKKLLEGEQFELYAGMNLPMLINYLNNTMIGSSNNLIEQSRESIVDVREILGVTN